MTPERERWLAEIIGVASLDQGSPSLLGAASAAMGDQESFKRYVSTLPKERWHSLQPAFTAQLAQLLRLTPAVVAGTETDTLYALYQRAHAPGFQDFPGLPLELQQRIGDVLDPPGLKTLSQASKTQFDLLGPAVEIDRRIDAVRRTTTVAALRLEFEAMPIGEGDRSSLREDLVTEIAIRLGQVEPGVQDEAVGAERQLLFGRIFDAIVSPNAVLLPQHRGKPLAYLVGHLGILPAQMRFPSYMGFEAAIDGIPADQCALVLLKLVPRINLLLEEERSGAHAAGLRHISKVQGDQRAELLGWFASAIAWLPPGDDRIQAHAAVRQEVSKSPKDQRVEPLEVLAWQVVELPEGNARVQAHAALRQLVADSLDADDPMAEGVENEYAEVIELLIRELDRLPAGQARTMAHRDLRQLLPRLPGRLWKSVLVTLADQIRALPDGPDRTEAHVALRSFVANAPEDDRAEVVEALARQLGGLSEGDDRIEGHKALRQFVLEIPVHKRNLALSLLALRIDDLPEGQDRTDAHADLRALAVTCPVEQRGGVIEDLALQLDNLPDLAVWTEAHDDLMEAIKGLLPPYLRLAPLEAITAALRRIYPPQP